MGVGEGSFLLHDWRLVLERFFLLLQLTSAFWSTTFSVAQWREESPFCLCLSLTCPWDHLSKCKPWFVTSLLIGPHPHCLHPGTDIWFLGTTCKAFWFMPTSPVSYTPFFIRRSVLPNFVQFPGYIMLALLSYMLFLLLRMTASLSSP